MLAYIRLAELNQNSIDRNNEPFEFQKTHVSTLLQVLLQFFPSLYEKTSVKIIKCKGFLLGVARANTRITVFQGIANKGILD